MRSEVALDLGKRLTDELGLDQSVDTLGRWMAHYVAQLMQDAENARPQERASRMRACSDAILTLWDHRHTLPDGKRPFEQLEPILRAVESLDPDNTSPRYFRSTRDATTSVAEDDPAKEWLSAADELDHAARVLIRYCLTEAARSAVDKTAEWIALAEEIGAEPGAESTVLRMIIEETNLSEASTKEAIAQERKEERIKRLEAFAEMAMALVAELREGTNSSPAGDESPTVE